MTYARVALDVPLHTLFDYHALGARQDDVGRRVLVPFGRKVLVGVIMELSDVTTVPPARIRKVLDVLRETPALVSDVLELLEFCSDYYHHPIGEVVLNALPVRLRRRQPVAAYAPQAYCLTALGMDAVADALPARAVVKRALLAALKARGALPQSALRTISVRAPAAIKELVEFGWVERIALPANSPHVLAPATSDVGRPQMTDEQSAAVVNIAGADETYRAWLLHGVTGSGKTEVYLRLIEAALGRGRQSLLLVPEINLTPQLEATVQARFPHARMVSLNSALNESERLQNWLAAQAGAADIVLGTRLAIFTPMPNLGLVIVDEEHDLSFKQTDGLRYSARDLAVARAKQRRIPVVLGSATPALETLHQAQLGRYQIASLTRRIAAAAPAIECVDIRKESLVDGLSQTLLRALRATITAEEQALVFINRRGYAPVLACAACGWTSDCPRCSVKMVLHLRDQRLRCHHCGHQAKPPKACPECGNQDLTPLGHGTQRIEAALIRVFPDARILRIDRDTTRRKNAWRDMRGQIERGEVDVLVGTQILAKGHDFPQLNLVGIVNADSSLYSTDFRSAERLYARLTQVAGRAGRGTKPGRVLVQTAFPEHALYRALRRADYTEYAQSLLAERKQAGLPPFEYQAVLRAEAHSQTQVLAFLARAADVGATIAQAVTLYDPVPAAMPKRAGLERAQLLVQARSRAALHAFVRAWRPLFEAAAVRNVRWTLEIDPQEL